MKKYDSYKDSDIEWIGEIPEHWSYSRLKLNSISKTGTTPSRDNNEYWDNGTVPWMSSGEINQRLISNIKSFVTEKAYKETSLTLFPKGSLVIAMNGQGKTKGMVGVLNIDTSFNQSLTAFQFNEKVNSRYVYYFLDSKYNELRGLVGEDREGLSSALLKNIYHPLPKFEEQTIIASYLDHKTTQIDNLIAKKEQFITLLQEERTAIINQAVTKGLDPNVPMKDSGIEWLGEIPEHWAVKRLKYILSEPLKYGANEAAEQDNIEDPRYIRITDFGNNGKLKPETFKSLPMEKANDYLLSNGDILFARSGATVGKTFLFKNYDGLACFAGYLIKASCNPNIVLFDFLYNFTNSSGYENWKQSIFQQSTIQNIGADKYNQLKIAIPSIKEQQKIVDYIEVKINEIEIIIGKAQQEIELLKEYKTALISEVVTGKVDVREEVLN